MSIPKEPRQLMINLMYLVLTAMLALNVSAEVINAFFKIDHGLEATNGILNTANTKVIESMEAAVEKRPDDRPLVDAAKQITGVVAEFNGYVDGVRERLIKMSDGLYTEENTTDKSKIGKPKKYKDKEIPQRLFVQGYDGKGGSLAGVEAAFPAEGPIFKEKVFETRNKITAILEEVSKKNPIVTKAEIDQLVANLPLSIDEEEWKEAGKNSWEQYVFGYMPVAAVFPIIRKFQTDAKNAESSVLGFLAKKIGGTVIEFNTFEPVASPKKGYIIKGETYEADIFLSAFSDQAKISVNVGGRSLPVKDGKAKYTATPGSYGEQSYEVSISVQNPFTGKSESYKKKFSYEVGERSAAIELEKMNVFYIGVDNPISVSVAGASSNQIRLSESGPITLSGSGGKYTVRASKPGDASLTVAAGDLNKTFKYRVKRIPDPIARLGNKDSGQVGSGEFKAQGGVGAWLDNFDFEAKCDVEGFILTRVAARQDPVDATNPGARFSGQAADLVQMAKPGDTYYFDNVRARCPGDPAARKINSLVFKIK